MALWCPSAVWGGVGGGGEEVCSAQPSCQRFFFSPAPFPLRVVNIHFDQELGHRWELYHLIHFQERTAWLHVLSRLQYIPGMLPSVRVIRCRRVSKDICPWRRWSEAWPAPQSDGSRSPAETLLRGRARMAERVSIAPWAQPGVGSPGPPRAATGSKEFKLCMTKVTPGL